jgi:tryptophanyl-tRNA synthetase
VIYSYLYSLFDEDDKNVMETYNQCKSGGIMCGTCKNRLAEMIKIFLTEHQKKRADAKAMVNEFMLKG